MREAPQGRRLATSCSTALALPLIIGEDGGSGGDGLKFANDIIPINISHVRVSMNI